jgi:hypothetical protein
MTKKIILLALVLASIISCDKKDNEAKNLHLTGNIEGLGQGKLYIQKIKDSSLVILDSIIIKGDSKFETFLQIEEPEMLYIFLDRGQTNSIDNNLPFFAEPGKMEISTTLKSFFADAKITGSKNHELYVEYSKIRSQFTNKSMELLQKELENRDKNNVKTTDSIKIAYDKLLKKKYLFIANYASTHGDKEIAPYLVLTEIADINMTFLDSINAKITPDVSKSKYGKILTKFVKDRKAAEKK